jgi:hypothetical protein
MEIGGSRYTPSVVATQLRTTSTGRARQPKVGFRGPDEEGNTAFPKSRPEPIKIGFGKDSVKIPNIMVATIKRNVRQARELIPTIEESEARVRDRVEEDARRLSERNRQAPKSLDLSASKQSAENNARSFISSLNTAAGEARFRTGTGEQPPTNRLDIRIGDTQVPFDKPESRPPLDLLA